MSLSILDRYAVQANMMRDMLEERMNDAMNYVTDKLGFNAWSRNLHDHEQQYAFLLPRAVYDNERLTRNLEKFISRVFHAHFLSVEESHVMFDSSNESIREVMGEVSDDRYIVDWCGSRCRHVELGPHIFFRIVFSGWFGRPRDDPEPPQLPLNNSGEQIAWEVKEEHESQYCQKQWAVLKPRIENLEM